jgi:hypothetical protein
MAVMENQTSLHCYHDSLGGLIVVVIIYLAVLSQRDNGFMTVHDGPVSDSLFEKYVLDTALLWTSLPSLIITLYNLF